MNPLIAILIAVAPATAHPVVKPSIQYVLRVDSTDLSGWSVTMYLRSRGEPIRLAMAAHPEYDDRYWRYVRDVTVDPPNATGHGDAALSPRAAGARTTLARRLEAVPHAERRADWRSAFLHVRLGRRGQHGAGFVGAPRELADRHRARAGRRRRTRLSRGERGCADGVAHPGRSFAGMALHRERHSPPGGLLAAARRGAIRYHGVRRRRAGRRASSDRALRRRAVSRVHVPPAGRRGT